MSDEERNTLLEEIDNFRDRYTQLNGNIPEAGGIAFATLYLDGLPINLTARATNPYDAISGLALAIRLSGKALHTTTEKPLPPQAPAPKVNTAVEIVRQENPTAAAQLEAGYNEVPPPPAGKEWITFDADRMTVIPQPDDKVTLEFYAGNDKFPKVKVNKWKIPDAQGLMKHATSADLSKAANLTVHCRVFWTEGKEGKTADGKVFHWKDVSHVRGLPY
jgi:hypothetical protein